jgi:uncharacterized protein YndB with AHSA1/START domain
MNAVIGIATSVVVVRRTIAATAEELFDAWLDPEAMAIWMRPGSIQTTVAKVDPTVGGRYEIMMRSATETYPHTGVYRVINRPRQLAFTWISRGTEERESLVTVEFVARDAGTEVIVMHEQLPAGAAPSHTDGWTSALARLDEACQQGGLQK